jgi:hypothetical protein
MLKFNKIIKTAELSAKDLSSCDNHQEFAIPSNKTVLDAVAALHSQMEKESGISRNIFDYNLWSTIEYSEDEEAGKSRHDSVIKLYAEWDELSDIVENKCNPVIKEYQQFLNKKRNWLSSIKEIFQGFPPMPEDVKFYIDYRVTICDRFSKITEEITKLNQQKTVKMKIEWNLDVYFYDSNE